MGRSRARCSPPTTVELVRRGGFVGGVRTRGAPRRGLVRAYVGDRVALPAGPAGDPCAFPRRATSVRERSTSTVLAATTRPRSLRLLLRVPDGQHRIGDERDLTVQPAETAAAVAQASRFSQVCRVWAPMYRQGTRRAGRRCRRPTPPAIATAYDSLLAAWKDYLAHDNDGRADRLHRPLAGRGDAHRLLAPRSTPRALLRKLMVSPSSSGATSQVPTGKTVGGSFKHIPPAARRRRRLRHRLLELRPTPPADASSAAPVRA